MEKKKEIEFTLTNRQFGTIHLDIKDEKRFDAMVELLRQSRMIQTSSINRKLGQLNLVCQSKEQYDAFLILFNDGEVLQ